MSDSTPSPDPQSTRRPRVPEGLTADKLRIVADSLDAMSSALLQSERWVHEDGTPASEDDVAKIREWVSETVMQEELRSWAYEIEAQS